MAQLDTLEIEISASSEDAVRHIDNLAASLNRLRVAANGGFGNLRGVATGLRGVADAVRGLRINVGTTQALADLLAALNALNGVRISPTIARELEDIVDIVRRVPNGVANRLNTMAAAIERLSRATERNGGNIRLTVRERGAREAAHNVGLLANVWNSLKRIAFYRIIRSAIKAVTETLQEGTQNAYKWSQAFESHQKGALTIAEAYDNLASASYKMGNQLGAAWASLIRAIEPILLQIINLVTRAANVITQFFALLGGRTTYLKAIDYSKKWADSTAAGAKAAKEWKNQLMGFDVINRLEAPSGSSGGGGGSTPDIGSMFEEVGIDANITDGFGKIRQIIEDNIAEISLIMGTALLAGGAILAFTGANIPLGLGLMVAGFALIQKEAVPHWGEMFKNVSSDLAKLEIIVGGALLGVGAILALSGVSVPIGLACIAAGIAIGAAGMLNWNGLSQQTQDTLAKISFYVGLSLLAVGAILALSGVSVAIGIACIAAGITSITAGHLNWNGVSEDTKKQIAEIQRYAGISLLAIGAVLAFSGVALPLGIALMAAGGVMLSTGGAKELNWNTIKENVVTAWDDMRAALKQKWEDFKSWLKGLKVLLDPFQIKMPHLSWYTTEASGWIAKILSALGLPTQIPHLSVSWYAKGGIVDGATLFGAGEAGAEAIVPLERNTEWIGKVAAEMNRQYHQYNDDEGEMIVNALYDVANIIVREMNSGNSRNNISFDRLAREVTRWQSNAARVNG